MERNENSITRSRSWVSVRLRAGGALASVGLLALFVSASAQEPKLASSSGRAASGPEVGWPQDPPPEVVIYASELPKRALSEFDFWDDPASPGGRLVGTPNTGDELDPPPENDPHVTFTVPVQAGIPYRCWIHMKVGSPKGVSRANMFYLQFSDAVDKANREVLKPRTRSYLTARGPAQPGWAWVGCDLEGSSPSESLVYFRKSGEVTVRMQAGEEGVGFDQFLLSPGRFLEQPPGEAVVDKQ